MEQIDLEEAIAEAGKPLTVSRYAAAHGVPPHRVRYSIEVGTLAVSRERRPMTIKEGELALTSEEWRRIIDPAVKRIKPSQCGWSDGGRVFTLVDARGALHEWKACLLRATAEQQRREIDAVPAKRVEVAV